VGGDDWVVDLGRALRSLGLEVLMAADTMVLLSAESAR
jgi:hypothetical protein